MKRNTGGQPIGAQMISLATGGAFAGVVTVSVTGDDGTQTTGTVNGGVCTLKGTGYYQYVPAKAETNYTQIEFTFVGTGAITVTQPLFTT